jgi:hypothetical protein
MKTACERLIFKLQKPLEGLQLEQELFIFFKIFESVAPGGEQENYEGPGEGGDAYAVPKNKANKAELSINKYGQFLFRNLWYFTDRKHRSRVESFRLNKEYRRILLSSYSAPIPPTPQLSQSVIFATFLLSYSLFPLCRLPELACPQLTDEGGGEPSKTIAKNVGLFSSLPLPLEYIDGNVFTYFILVTNFSNIIECFNL